MFFSVVGLVYLQKKKLIINGIKIKKQFCILISYNNYSEIH